MRKSCTSVISAFLLFALTASCTKAERVAGTLHWRHLSNKKLVNLSFSEAVLSSDTTTFTGTNGTVTVKLVERKARDIQEMLLGYKTQWQHAESTFKTMDSPYPGMISREKTCPDRFRGTQLGPRQGETEAMGFFIQATSRMTLGVCNEEDGVYTALIGTVYCEKSQVMYDYKVFIGKTSDLKPLDIYMEFKCI
jgi:hypothetical protein